MQKQRNASDCLNCCLSELLNIPYEDIPPFWKVWKNGIKQKPTKKECDEKVKAHFLEERKKQAESEKAGKE